MSSKTLGNVHMAPTDSTYVHRKYKLFVYEKF